MPLTFFVTGNLNLYHARNTKPILFWPQKFTKFAKKGLNFCGFCALLWLFDRITHVTIHGKSVKLNNHQNVCRKKSQNPRKGSFTFAPFCGCSIELTDS